MSSVMRFDEWQDSDGNPVFNGAGGPLATPAILQVVSSTATAQFSTASTSFVGVTGLSVTITPSSATSKILLVGAVQASSSVTNGAGTHFRLSGGNTASYVGDASGSRVQGVGFRRQNNSFYFSATDAPVQGFNFLDSPATTSAVTYQVELRVSAGTSFVNRSAEDLNSSSAGRGASTITVMEVAG